MACQALRGFLQQANALMAPEHSGRWGNGFFMAALGRMRRIDLADPVERAGARR